MSRPSDAPADAVLLRDWVEERDDEAIRQVVRRYEPFAHSACRRGSGDGADADEAAQATCIALSQQGAAIRDPSRLTACPASGHAPPATAGRSYRPLPAGGAELHRADHPESCRPGRSGSGLVADQGHPLGSTGPGRCQHGADHLGDVLGDHGLCLGRVTAARQPLQPVLGAAFGGVIVHTRNGELLSTNFETDSMASVLAFLSFRDRP